MTLLRRKHLPWFLAAFTIVAAALILLAMGRVPICTCGYVKLWHGEVVSSGNSQHLTDWYTPSHIIHGILFYASFWIVARRMALGWRFCFATLIEAGWEVLENSPVIIDRYRSVTISLDYYGDSVINSVSDILAMVAGFWIAWKAPVWVSVVVVIGFEALTTWLIRDGLALNILMLLWPLDAVRVWQGGA